MRYLCALVALFFLISNSAMADEVVFKPYIGLDLQRISYNYEDSYDTPFGQADGNDLIEQNLDGINIHIGSRFGKYLGLELGYFKTAKEDKSASTQIPGFGTLDSNTEVSAQGFTLDGMAYLPLGEEGLFELIGTSGISWTTANLDIDAPGFEDVDSDEFGLRVGAGMQYNMTDYLNLRGLVRYQMADFDGVAENAVIFSAGMNYVFK